MTQGERVKEVRRTQGLTLEKFGERLGVKKNSVSQIENGHNRLTDQMAKAICREFGVSESWLRTGEGELFIQISRDQEIMDFVADTMQDDKDNFRRRFLLALSRLPEERWADIEAFARQITAENKEADQD